MSFKNYYDQLNSQKGIKAFIKKRIFNNLLKELVKQEKELEKQKEIIRSQEKKIKEQEQILKMQGLFLDGRKQRLYRKTVKIIQMAPTLGYEDAVGNDIVALHRLLESLGYDTEIYAENVDARLKSGKFKSYKDFPDLLPDDIVLYHFSTGSAVMEKVLRGMKCRRIMIYHNITPDRFFEEYNPKLAKLCGQGRIQLRQMKDLFECCLADSEYNRQDLRKEGYTCPIGVLPILIPFEKYNQAPDETVLEKYREDGTTNILFVGRVVPNKKQEDVIKAFAYYHSHINPDSRLFIVGGEGYAKKYCSGLHTLVKEKGIEDSVVFTGHVPFPQLLAYYRLADLLLCMSEHEGFCVPMVEALLFSVPVVAYRASAVPETLGDAGILVDTKEPAAVAQAMDRVVKDATLRKTLQYLMQQRLEEFSYEKTAATFNAYLDAILERRGLENALPVSDSPAMDSLLLRDSPGLLIDVSEITKNDWGTGIQRVVNNLFHQIFNQSQNVIPVQNKSGKFITSYSYLSRMEGVGKKPDRTPAFYKGDNIFLLDNPWKKSAEFSRILDLAYDTHIKSYAIVHDLIPLQYPGVCISEEAVEEHIEWHDMILQKADAIVCVSRATADDVAAYYAQKKFKRNRPLSLYYFHLGADVPAGEQSVRSEIRDFVNGGKYTFLMVGTLEPRKGHMTVLESIRRLPEKMKEDCRFLIIGGTGWKSVDVRKTMKLPEFAKNVLWVGRASDEDLRWAYAHADALIAASMQEGFGLPLVEAAYFGLPLICSDIPVFREVTRGHADFFTVMDPDSLADCLIKWVQTDKHPDSRKLPVYSWEESSREVLDIMEGKTEPYKVLQ